MTRSNNTDSIQLNGDYIVSVGDSVVLDVTEEPEHAEYAPELFAKGNDVYYVVHNSSSLEAVETVYVTEDMVDAFIEIMYTTQRASSINEWDKLPTATSDTYDSLVYLQAHIRANKGMVVYQDELEDMNHSDRYKTNELPEWADLQ